jgi:dihydrofolate reductase
VGKLIQSIENALMRKLTTFNFITLNGYFKGPDNDTSWHKHGGVEETEYAAKGLQSKSTLLFGRVTYNMMAGYWPSPMALENDPVVAKGMNDAEKIVFSTKLKKTAWKNTRVVNNMVEEIKKMRSTTGNDMTILGSGSIISQLSDLGLIDEYQIMLDPIALGSGTPIFNKINRHLNLKLTKSKVFKSGTVLLCYEPQ